MLIIREVFRLQKQRHTATRELNWSPVVTSLLSDHVIVDDVTNNIREPVNKRTSQKGVKRFTAVSVLRGLTVQNV
jgi:hypothetical protein